MRNQIGNDSGMARSLVGQPVEPRVCDLALLGIGTVGFDMQVVGFERGDDIRGIPAIPHQGRIQILQSLRGEPARIEVDILTDEGVVAQDIGDGNEVSGAAL
jgi:hypothetical protein